jgi:tetratricopeptide (TPR) repeat protein
VSTLDSTARETGRAGDAQAAPTPALDTSSSVDEESPWLGLSSFTEETRAYFFGREGEVAELERRVQRKLLTVLFGKSGLGKTSILRAGLVPGLRGRGYFPVYLRIDYGHDSPEPAEQIKQGIEHAAASGTAVSGEWTQTAVATPGESIWEFLHHRDDVLKDSSGATLTPLLIFDQFEELFTLAQSDEFGRARAARFVEELADLVENRPPKALEARLDSDDSIAERFDFSRSDYRVVIALREDYLAPLEGLKRQMPSLSQNRLRLAPMTGSQALEAVLRPGKHLVSEEVAEAIVRFVAGGAELANAEVEPSLLSLICRELNEQRIAQGRSEISQDLLAGSHNTILSTFYERSLADQPESVRRIIEDDLLTESGYRENLAEESLLKRFQAVGAAPDALAKLVNRRLLRIEERLDVRRVELTHDVLTGVVKASRDLRHEREAKEATERALAEQRAREEAAHRALRRTRVVAAGCTLLAAVAFAAAIFALVSFRRARHAELIAQQTRAVSEQARQQAEHLLGFLTDDFSNELGTFGRFQTIAELSQREIDYFQRLPASLEDPETIRSNAAAQIGHATALFELSGAGPAIRNETQAVALLESLRQTDKSEETTIGLGRAYTWLCFFTQGPKGAPICQRGVNLLRPIAERAGASVESRRAYLQGSTWLALQDLGQNRFEETVRASQEALRVGKQLGVPHDGDPVTDADDATAGAYLSVALAGLGRTEDARRAGEAALDIADRVLAQHPQFGEALGAKVMALGEGLNWVAENELDPTERIRYNAEDVQTALTLVGIEPNNYLYRFDLGLAYAQLGESMWFAGRLREALGQFRDGMRALGEAGAGFTGGLDGLREIMINTDSWDAQLGDAAGVAAVVPAASPYMSPSALANAGPFRDEYQANFEAARAYSAATLAYERGDFGAAQRITRAAVARLEPHRANAPYKPPVDATECSLSDLEARAAYARGDFAGAAQAETTALRGCKVNVVGNNVSDQRDLAQLATWRSMALAREGKRDEAAGTIAPVVAMYRALEARNRGDRWLPLEFAEALYAQSLTDPSNRAAPLREAAGLVDHLIPAIAKLHDTREWRARIEAARGASLGRKTP